MIEAAVTVQSLGVPLGNVSAPFAVGSAVLQQSTLYAVLTITEDSATTLSYNESGDIDFNDYYLNMSSVWISNSTTLTPNPVGTADFLFQYDSNSDIQPISR